MKLALQLFTVREGLDAEHIKETLAKVKAMGYDGVEWFGLLDYTPAELAAMTKEAGLEFFSMHVNINDILACDTEILDGLAENGVQYLPIGWLPQERLAGGELFDETCDLLRSFSEEAAARGMLLMYHNHAFDLTPMDDETMIDKLYAAFPGDVLGAELDTCWLYTGGVDPAAYIRKYADRAPIIHLKDCVKEGGHEGFKPVGSGVLDWDGILYASEKAEWVCVEQDEPSDGLDAFACAASSAAFLGKKLGR